MLTRPEFGLSHVTVTLLLIPVVDATAVLGVGAGRLTFGGVPENDAIVAAFSEPNPACASRSEAISGNTWPSVISMLCSSEALTVADNAEIICSLNTPIALSTKTLSPTEKSIHAVFPCCSINFIVCEILPPSTLRIALPVKLATAAASEDVFAKYDSRIP